jgi:hypothetical protein
MATVSKLPALTVIVFIVIAEVPESDTALPVD